MAVLLGISSSRKAQNVRRAIAVERIGIHQCRTPDIGSLTRWHGAIIDAVIDK
jgi:hypothetical protein